VSCWLEGNDNEGREAQLPRRVILSRHPPSSLERRSQTTESITDYIHNQPKKTRLNFSTRQRLASDRRVLFTRVRSVVPVRTGYSASRARATILLWFGWVQECVYTRYYCGSFGVPLWRGCELCYDMGSGEEEDLFINGKFKVFFHLIYYSK
jgi:hypothetical protein